MLTGILGSARALLLQLENAEPWLDRLSEDFPPAAELVTSAMVARSDQLGSLAHLHRVTGEITAELSKVIDNRALR